MKETEIKVDHTSPEGQTLNIMDMTQDVKSHGN